MSMVALEMLERWVHSALGLHIKLFDGKMMGSIVVFFSNPSPPSPRPFVLCTGCALCAGVIMHAFHASTRAPAIAAGLHLFFSKLSGVSFSATAGLAVKIAQAPWGGASLSAPLSFLLFPWTAGHCLLYAFALAAAVPRRAARVALARSWAIQSVSEITDEARLREAFQRYDTSGDGCIDATEFRFAYRTLSGSDLPLRDCEAIIRQFDTDGSGKLDYCEFKHGFAHSDSTPTANTKQA